MKYAVLSDRALLRLSGEDTLPFLQGLITNNVALLDKGQAVYAALLTPQGKFLHDFFLYPQENAILLDVATSRVSDLLQRLKMYKLRSKVTMEETPLTISAVWDGSPGKGFADPRLPALGYRVIGKWEQGAAGNYDSMRLALGVPAGGRDLIIERSLLLEWSFEDLHGVDFQKGCYVGQEVTARSKHRAQLRKHFYQVQPVSGTFPASGSPIHIGSEDVGELRSHDEKNGLAVIKIEAVERANSELICGDAVLKATLPQWVTEKPQALAIE